MGAIAGVFARTGQEIDDRMTRRLSAALEQVGPDGEHIATTPRIFMLHRPLYTDTDSRRSAEPLTTSTDVMIAWDGRLDNTDELARLLGGQGSTSILPQTLLFAAYRRYGPQAFAHFIGDFACAIWDPASQHLVLACDSLGMRSLSYSVTDDLCIWSTTGRSIAAARRTSLVPDKDYLAAFLVNQASTHSALEGIEVIQGGHALIVTAASTRLQRYWAFNPSAHVECASDEDYAAQFRRLFEQAVRCRIKAEAPVFCELSGGVDSSSIACMADRLRRLSPATIPDIRTVSYVFHRSRTSDETPFIEAVEAQLGRAGLHIDETEHELLTPYDPSIIRVDFPTNQLCFMARNDRLRVAMNEAGAQVLLSGIGGDQVFLSWAPEALALADLVAQRRWGALLKATPEWARALSWPYWKTFWRGACWPLLPHRWQAHTLHDKDAISKWLHPEFVRRTQLRERSMLMQADDLGFRLPSSALHYGLLRQTCRRFALERCTTTGAVDMRYPYLDRRLVEFALALPFAQKVRLGETRSIVRRGLRGIVPDSIRLRESKFGPTEAFYRALNRQWPWISTLLAAPRVCEYEVVEHRALITVDDEQIGHLMGLAKRVEHGP